MSAADQTEAKKALKLWLWENVPVDQRVAREYAYKVGLGKADLDFALYQEGFEKQTVIKQK